MTNTPKKHSDDKPSSGFVIAQLPKFELLLYYAVWISHAIGAFVVVFNITNRLRRSLERWLPQSDYMPDYHMDTTDPEWSFYRIAIFERLIAFVFHSAVFYIIPKLFSKRATQYIMIVCWLGVHLYLTSLKCMLTFAAFAVFTIVISLIVHTELVAWVICIAFIMEAQYYAPFSVPPRIYYREHNFYLYGAIKVINYCIHLSRNKINSMKELDIIRCAQYILYPPYSTLLIVLYDDFESQINRVEAEQQKSEIMPLHLTKGMVWKVVRLIFWYFAFEFVLHFIYVYSILNLPFPIFNLLNIYELAATAYVNGQLFYWKYVLIFGIPSWFALFDGMKPPDPPICIARVSRYSRMWRYFDRGLYQFLKLQVYLPLVGDIKGTFGSWRRFGAMVGAFLFVLAWHGATKSCILWVTLSASELIIERIGYMIACTSLWCRLSIVIGKRNKRRLIAFAMIATVIPGVFGVFFFLGQDGFGEMIFEKLLIQGFFDVISLDIAIRDGLATAGFVFIHFILLGYCFNNVCLQLDESITREKPIDRPQKKTD
ncbi:unnamed protein product [Anisakis simplex]|uniref:Protein-cysteine N-palmitoyltransferase HHAT (inferred by orthology to a human protein) n=1 Tax=Anisakis simplex TaxID=6269 RepID=A0A0M3JV50_ANISI|nr:unnamed protein product [Anisakis simplex]